ncbi:MAG: helix-turn-helix domain-containing protein [Nostoc sp. S4]|nr:helix-turn-helix domain-containing protein [Nostoc sp. S4]
MYGTQVAREYIANIEVFDTTCAAPQVLEHIASKWVVLIIYVLSQGTKRYSQLQQQIKGISPKMLIQNLRKLEACGLVQRVVHPVMPPQVDYSLTPLGETLVDPLAVLCEWAVEHVHELKPARKIQERRFF